jgi:hypothetical protein
MSKSKTYYKKLAVKMIDFVLEMFDVIEIGEKLIEYGLSYDDLLELGYSKKVIKEIQKEIDKGLAK